jgi:hypothetical protein
MWSRPRQHHRPVGQVGDGLAEIRDDLLGVRGAFGDLAHAPVQGPQAHGGAAQVQVQPDPVRAVQQPEQVTGSPAGQDRLAYTLGDASWPEPREVVVGPALASVTRAAT